MHSSPLVQMSRDSGRVVKNGISPFCRSLSSDLISRFRCGALGTCAHSRSISDHDPERYEAHPDESSLAAMNHRSQSPA